MNWTGCWVDINYWILYSLFLFYEIFSSLAPTVIYYHLMINISRTCFVGWRRQFVTIFTLKQYKQTEKYMQYILRSSRLYPTSEKLMDQVGVRGHYRTTTGGLKPKSSCSKSKHFTAWATCILLLPASKLDCYILHNQKQPEPFWHRLIERELEICPLPCFPFFKVRFYNSLFFFFLSLFFLSFLSFPFLSLFFHSFFHLSLLLPSHWMQAAAASDIKQGFWWRPKYNQPTPRMNSAPTGRSFHSF